MQKNRCKRKGLYSRTAPARASAKPADILDAAAVPVHAFELREDGTLLASGPPPPDGVQPKPQAEAPAPVPPSPPRLVYRHEQRGLWLYHCNCLELLDAIAAKYPEGRFDTIFADPPYFLSNRGITCHAGRMVRVDNGGWEKSRPGTQP